MNCKEKMRLDDTIRKFSEFYKTDFKEFDRVKYKLSRFPDLHVLRFLETIVEVEYKTLIAFDNSNVYLNVNAVQIKDAKLLMHTTEEIICELVRCGVLCNNVGQLYFSKEEMIDF